MLETDSLHNGGFIELGIALGDEAEDLIGCAKTAVGSEEDVDVGGF